MGAASESLPAAVRVPLMTMLAAAEPVLTLALMERVGQLMLMPEPSGAAVRAQPLPE